MSCLGLISSQEFCITITYIHSSSACRMRGKHSNWSTHNTRHMSSYLHDTPVNNCLPKLQVVLGHLHSVLIHTVFPTHGQWTMKDCYEEYSHTSNRFYFLVLVLNPWKQEI